MIGITNIKVYSELDGKNKVSAVEGVLDESIQCITLRKPYQFLNGGPVENQYFKLAYDQENQVVNIKDLKFSGIRNESQDLLFTV